jgi:hypothetical protein
MEWLEAGEVFGEVRGGEWLLAASPPDEVRTLAITWG